MTAPLTISDMQANVAQSRGHITKQEAIIARLTEQGHAAMVVTATSILATMHGHLTTELAMLARMEGTPGHA